MVKGEGKGELFYESRLMPLKWTITNGTHMLFGKTDGVSLERREQANKKSYVEMKGFMRGHL